MTARAIAATVAFLLLPSAWSAAGAGDERPEPEAPAYGATPEEMVPYRGTGSSWRFFEAPPPYRGPGRDKAAADGLPTVKVGLIAPIESPIDSAIGRAMLRGAELAIDEANAAGGFRGATPFELVVRNDSGLWGATSNTMVDLAWGEGVWGVVGSVDGGNTHIALRVALKAETPIVNTACTDPTLTETAIPWIFRCYPDDRQHGYRLAGLLVRERGLRRIAVLRSNDKYGRMGIAEFRDALRRLGVPVPLEVRHGPGETEFDVQLERIRAMEADAVVLWTNATDAGRIVAAMRAAGMTQPVFGTDRLVSREFLEAAGDAAEGVVATSPMDPAREDEAWTEFRARFRARFGESPDAFAAFTYDGTRMLLEAIESAGLNRVLIRDELAAVEARDGVTGPMRFDATHNNLGELILVRVRSGRFERADEPRQLGAFQTSFRTPPSERVAAGKRALGIVVVEGDPASVEAARGAALAVEEANARNGAGEDPFVLEIGETKGAWSSAAETCRDLAYERECLGVMSPSSGEIAHLLAQVAVRGRLPVIALSGEGSLTRVPVPWMFRLAPDRRDAIVALAAEAPGGGAGLPAVVPAGRAGRACREDLAAAFRALGIEPGPVLTLDELRDAPGAALGGSSAAMLLLSGEELAGALDALRRAGWEGTVLTDDPDPAVGAGDGVEVKAYRVFDASEPEGAAGRFAAAYRSRHGADPSSSAACGYDAARLLIEAVRSAGPDRSAVRDRLVGSRPDGTVTGFAGFDGSGNRRGIARVETIPARAARMAWAAVPSKKPRQGERRQ